MATAAQVIKAALQKILVQASEAPFEADDYQDAIFAMNLWMTDLQAQGIALGYTEVSNLSDEVTIPTGALRGLINNLAIEVSPDYGGVVSQELRMQAASGLDTMRQIGQLIPETAYPSTLPIGSGNYDQQFGVAQFFYPEQEAEILGESTGSIGLESETDV
jgi:hypothetical protein